MWQPGWYGEKIYLNRETINSNERVNRSSFFNSDFISENEKRPITSRSDEDTNNTKEESEEQFLILPGEPTLLVSIVFFLTQ